MTTPAASRVSLSPTTPAATTTTLTATSTPSLASGNSSSAEPPIKIVEATPAAASGTQLSSVLPFREPQPAPVVQATPAVPFNASGSAAEMTQLPRPGIHAPAVPLNRTRGFIPAQPSGAGSFRTDSSVKPAGYVEAVPSAASGEWRAR
jgi:hypothetical protein